MQDRLQSYTRTKRQEGEGSSVLMKGSAAFLPGEKRTICTKNFKNRNSMRLKTGAAGGSKTQRAVLI